MIIFLWLIYAVYYNTNLQLRSAVYQKIAQLRSKRKKNRHKTPIFTKDRPRISIVTDGLIHADYFIQIMMNLVDLKY